MQARSLCGVLACRGGRVGCSANAKSRSSGSLCAGGLREEVVRTYAERDPVFRDLARHIVEVDVQQPSDSLTRYAI